MDADNITFSFKAPTEKLKDVFDLIRTLMTDPAFDPKSLDKMKSFDPSAARLATSSERNLQARFLFKKCLMVNLTRILILGP